MGTGGNRELKEIQQFAAAVRKMGWLSSYSRQALLSRQLLRYLQDKEVQNELAWITPKRFLLDHFRAVISSLSGFTQSSRTFSAPYEPAAGPDTCFLAYSRKERLFELSVSSGMPSFAFYTANNSVGWEHSTSLAVEDYIFMEEVSWLGRGVSLFNKKIADDRVGELRSRKLFGNDLERFAIDFSALDWWYKEKPEIGEFWRRWYRGFLTGNPINWDLQRRIAAIEQATWDLGPAAIADAIRAIETDQVWNLFPQMEDVFEADDGRYDVRSVFSDPNKLIDSIENRVRFTLDLAVQSNACDLNDMSTAAKTLRHALNNCLDDPNALEQFLRRASEMIQARMADGSFSSDDELTMLVATLDELALQLRADHPDVAQAVDARASQRFKELDQEKRLAGAQLIEDLREGTTGRLDAELGLATETLRDGSSDSANADALKQSGNRAGKISLAERARAAESSGPMAGLKIGMRAHKVVEFVLGLISSGPI